jgi:Uma2 family endonuclease
VIVTDVAPDSLLLAEPIVRLSVAQYRRMAEAHVFGPDDDIELLEGLLVRKMTKNPPHRIATRRTRVALEQVVPAGWYVDSQEPIETEDSEPEPDVAVIRGTTESYADHHPPASAVGLVVEVAEATLRRDRELKDRIYARAGIPLYWVVNLAADRLEVYSQPIGRADSAKYASYRELARDDSAPVILDGVQIALLSVASLLPPKDPT